MARTNKVEVEVEAQYTGLVVRPGDTLVVAMSSDMNMLQHHRLKELIESTIPGVKVLIISEAVGMAVYRRGDGDEDGDD